MTSTDWENKFSSIVRDTETNLERVKNKLGSARTSAISSDNRSVLTSLSVEAANWPRTSRYDTRPSAYQVPASESVISRSPNADVAYVPFEKSPSLIMLLNEKMDTQAKTIDQLMKNIQKNEEERDSHSRQVRELREELTRMRSRMAERGVDLVTEQKITRWQQEWSMEMQALQSQMQSLRSRNDEVNAKNVALTATVNELQRFVSTEVEYLRREISSLKNKTDSLHTDVSNSMFRRREFEQNKANTDSRHFMTQSMPLTADNKPSVSFVSPSYSRSILASNFNGQASDSNADSLRLEYKAMQKKLKSLEANFHATMTKTSQRSKRRPRLSEHYTSESNDQTSFTASELDLSTPTNYSDRLRVVASTSYDDGDILPSTDLPSDLSTDNEYSL